MRTAHEARSEVGSATAERLAFTSELRAPSWIESSDVLVAQVYEDELPWIEQGAHGWFSPTNSPSTRVEIQRRNEPPMAWDRSTSRVRFQLDPTLDLAVGTVGWVSFPTAPRRSLMVPAGGVLQGADGPYVVVLGGGGAYEKRRVEIGKVLNRYAIVVSGLREHERIAVNDNFSLDAERRVQLLTESTGPAPP
jgi:hypothetical protein